MTFDWWTFGLQTVNVLILVWILARFFWRPVAGMIEERRKRAQNLLAKARQDREAAAQALAEAQSRSAGFAEEREAILAGARQEASEVKRALLDQAQAEATQTRAETEADLTRQRAAAEEAWAAQAGRLAVTIAGKLAARLDGEAVRAAFLSWLVEKIAAQPEQVRQTIVRGGGPIELVSAAPLDADERARVTAALSTALGATTATNFSVDPQLIAGLELHTPHFVLVNSWRADLDEILAELNDDRRD